MKEMVCVSNLYKLEEAGWIIEAGQGLAWPGLARQGKARIILQ